MDLVSGFGGWIKISWVFVFVWLCYFDFMMSSVILDVFVQVQVVYVEFKVWGLKFNFQCGQFVDVDFDFSNFMLSVFGENDIWYDGIDLCNYFGGVVGLFLVWVLFGNYFDFKFENVLVWNNFSLEL